MAPPKKSPERRQRTNSADVGLVVVEGGLSDMPAPEPDWLPVTADHWLAFWGSESAQLVRESHRQALHRLFGWYDRQERCWQAAEKFRKQAEREMFIEGSKGQPVLTPLFDVAAKAEADALAIEAKIVALEDRFGLSPAAELKLGVTFQRRQNLEAMNRAMWEAEGVDDADQADPRALPGDTAAASS